MKLFKSFRDDETKSNSFLWVIKFIIVLPLLTQKIHAFINIESRSLFRWLFSSLHLFCSLLSKESRTVFGWSTLSGVLILQVCANRDLCRNNAVVCFWKYKNISKSAFRACTPACVSARKKTCERYSVAPSKIHKSLSGAVYTRAACVRTRDALPKGPWRGVKS